MAGVDSEFETGAGWTLYPATGSEIGYDTTVYHSPTRSAKVSIPGTVKRNSGQWISDKMSLSPGQKKYFRAWGKTQGVVGLSYSARIRLVEANSSGLSLRQWTLPFGPGTVDWRVKSLNFTAGANTAYWYLIIDIQAGYGTLNIDDVVIGDGNDPNPPIPDEVPPPPPPPTLKWECVAGDCKQTETGTMTTLAECQTTCSPPPGPIPAPEPGPLSLVMVLLIGFIAMVFFS